MTCRTLYRSTARALLLMAMMYLWGCTPAAEPGPMLVVVPVEEDVSVPVVEVVTVEILSGPERLTNQGSAFFELGCSGTEDCLFRCDLDDQGFVPCDAVVTYADLADGRHHFTVSAMVADGEWSEPESWTWTVDRALPEIVNLRGPQTVTESLSATFHFECSKEGCSFLCKLDDEAFDGCVSGVTYSDLDEGFHTFEVYAQDRLLNVGPAVSWKWMVGGALPEVLDLEGPEPLTNQTTARFEFRCSLADCTYECDLNQSGFEACDPGVTYDELEDGEHVLRVRPVDMVGRRGEDVRHEWTVDTEAPEVVDLSGPSELTNATSARLFFACSKANCQFECSVNGGPLEACESGDEVTGLADGAQSFAVRASDAVGNVGPFSTYEWSVDTVAPVVENLSGPDVLTSVPTALVSFSCSKAQCEFFCELSSSAGVVRAESVCPVPVIFSDLVDEDYVFSVWAIDPAGNISAVESLMWTVDTLAPHILDLDGPAAQTNATLAGFTFICSEEDCTYVCTLTDELGGVVESECESPVGYAQLADGDYVFYVHAIDPAGNQGPAESWEWRVDTVPLQIAILETPEPYTERNTAVFDFECNKFDCSYECALEFDDGVGAPIQGAWEVCYEPYQADGLEAGVYTFHVRGVDRAGNVGVAEHTWEIWAREWAPTVKISAAVEHTCSVRADGTMWCWGENLGGKLGLGHQNYDRRTTPTRVGWESDWTDVETSERSSCGIRRGELWCWGINLHNGSLATTPRRVGEEVGWSQLSMGRVHACGIREGELWCWGENFEGQLGVGERFPHADLSRAGDQSDWTQVSAGDLHTCGLRQGQLWCWGHNLRGSLGLGDTIRRSSPTRVGEEDDWTQVSAGYLSTCGLRQGQLWCWGYNSMSELGQGDYTQRNEPTRTGTESDWTHVTVGYRFACAIRAGTLWCWGGNFRGKLGVGSRQGHFTTPTREAGAANDWSRVWAGFYHACGIRNGEPWCWGKNRQGQLGQGSHGEIKRTPQSIDTANTYLSITAAGGFTCGVRHDATLWCWGANSHNQLGLDDTTHDRQRPEQVGTASGWTDVSGGARYACGLRQGELWCWGRNHGGQLGLGDFLDRSSPTRVGDANDWARLSTGGAHTCAIRQDGSLWCWGSNAYGNLGLGDTVARPEPTRVGDATDWTHVSTNAHTCGVRAGELWCWGYNNRGMLGLGDNLVRTVPTRVQDANDWTHVSAGIIHTCGVRAGELWCWGGNSHSNLGLGDTLNRYDPTRVGDANDWNEVAANNNHSCAIRSGTLLCWGRNAGGVLGIGEEGNQSTPHVVGAATDWTTVTVSASSHTCGLRNGNLWCWGINSDGQLGDYSRWRDVPYPVLDP